MSTINAQELARRLGVTPRTVQKWAREQRIPSLKIGRALRFLPEQVDEILAAHTRDAVEPRPDAHQPNPAYSPYLQVVPMRRSGTAA